MKVITEAIIRAELKATEPEVYYIPEGKILSPAAREYLNQMQIDIDYEKNKTIRETKAETEPTERKENPAPEVNASRFIDYETGASYSHKPEHMTHLFGNQLVDKDHPRIKYRGKLDRLQADTVYAQAVIASTEKNEGILQDLDDILDTLRELMRCEVLDEPFTKETILGLDHDTLRKQSHAPMKYFNIKQMLLPDYSMGLAYSLLNMLRTEIRELEVVAVGTFKEKRKLERSDIIQELNRLSSALHIMMCKYLAGEYSKKNTL